MTGPASTALNNLPLADLDPDIAAVGSFLRNGRGKEAPIPSYTARRRDAK